MSLYDYQSSKEIARMGPPFYSLIMAAMRQADSVNIEKLRAAWPDVHAELIERYTAPGGAITDRELEQLQRAKEKESSI